MRLVGDGVDSVIRAIRSKIQHLGEREGFVELFVAKDCGDGGQVVSLGA